MEENIFHEVLRKASLLDSSLVDGDFAIRLEALEEAFVAHFSDFSLDCFSEMSRWCKAFLEADSFLEYLEIEENCPDCFLDHFFLCWMHSIDNAFEMKKFVDRCRDRNVYMGISLEAFSLSHFLK